MLAAMQKPPITDAAFQVIDHKGPGLGTLVLWFLWLSAWGAAAYHAESPWWRVCCVVLSAVYPLIGRFLLMLTETVSYQQADWLRARMDPRRPRPLKRISR